MPIMSGAYIGGLINTDIINNQTTDGKVESVTKEHLENVKNDFDIVSKSDKNEESSSSPNGMMVRIYSGLKVAILFILIMLVTQTIGGDKGAKYMSGIILFSMLILSADVISDGLKSVTENLTN